MKNFLLLTNDRSSFSVDTFLLGLGKVCDWKGGVLMLGHICKQGIVVIESLPAVYFISAIVVLFKICNQNMNYKTLFHF